MAERVVKVKITAEIANYVAGMEKMSKATAEAGSEAEKLSQKREAFNLLGKAALIGGAAVAAGVGVAIAKFADFDQAMSFVSAATHETADNMALLRQAALDAGAKTVFSATEAANAVEELGKAGLSTKDILGGGLNGALALAAAGGLGVAEAATISATALAQFGLNGSKAGHVADLLAAGAGKAQGDVTDLGAALNQAGLVANQTGLTIEETTGILSAFAHAGLLGSDAGTSLKTMLQRLTPQSAEAAAKIDELNVSAYDSQGNFIGATQYAGKLYEGLKKLTPEARNSALAVMFGSDAVRGASVLYNEGAKGIQGWIDKSNDAGYAADTAARRMDNLKGDIEQLGGSIDTALIQSGSAANEVLRGMAQTATNLVNLYGSLPVPVQQASLAIGVVTAAAALSGGAFLLAVPKIVEYRAALESMGTGAQNAGKALGGVTKFLFGPWGLALAAAAVVGYQFVDIAQKQAKAVDDLTDSLDANTGAFTDNTRQLVVSQLTHQNVYKRAKEAGIALDTVTDAALGNKKAMAEVTEKADAYAKKLKAAGEDINAGNFKDIANDVRDQSGALKEATDKWKLNKEAMGESSEATDEAATSTNTAADAYKAAAGEASGLTDEVKQLTDEVNKANGVGQDAVSANSAYQDALSKVAEQIDNVRKGTEGYAAGLDLATQAGRDNYGVLLDQAKAGQEAADAQFAVDGNTQAYVATLNANRETVLQNARDLGATDEQLQYISDHIVAMPNQKQIDLIANTNEAKRKIQEVLDLINSVPASRVTSVGVTVSNGAFGDAATKRATGGSISGPGSGTSDSIPAYLSNGEHVLTAADVAAAGGQAAVYAWRRSLHGAPGFANGGSVGYTTSSTINNGSPITIYEAADPVAVAQAVSRRENRMAAV